jgi:hypothetical protein
VFPLAVSDMRNRTLPICSPDNTVSPCSSGPVRRLQLPLSPRYHHAHLSGRPVTPCTASRLSVLLVHYDYGGIILQRAIRVDLRQFQQTARYLIRSEMKGILKVFHCTVLPEEDVSIVSCLGNTISEEHDGIFRLRGVAQANYCSGPTRSFRSVYLSTVNGAGPRSIG